MLFGLGTIEIVYSYTQARILILNNEGKYKNIYTFW